MHISELGKIAAPVAGRPAVLRMSLAMRSQRPNILVILTDQMRADAFGAAGNSVIRTPTLDRLCERGVNFTRAYTPSPVCVSARASLLTGMLPHRTGCTDNGKPQPPADVTSLYGLLSDAGYQTHCVGKTHFAPHGRGYGFQSLQTSEEMPRSAETDAFLSDLIAAGFGHVHEPHGMRSELYYVPQVSQLPARLHQTAWVADQSMAFLRQRDRTRPFFLKTSFIKPHPPFDPPVPWNTLYRMMDMPLPHRPSNCRDLHTWHMRHQNRYKYRDGGPDNNIERMIKAFYYACVSFIDHHVGRLLDALEKLGELDNTLILFTSDHGELLGDYHAFGKRSFLEPAARVPMIASHPGRLPEGETCNALTSLLDVMPTCLQAAGVDFASYDLDGLALQDVAAGRAQHDYLIGQLNDGPMGLYMIRDDRWKYIYSAPDERAYLFDLVQDPNETVNRIDDPSAADEAHRLQSQLRQRLVRDGHAELFEGDPWKRFGRRPDPVDADEVRLTQHAKWTDPTPPMEGYRDPTSS